MAPLFWELVRENLEFVNLRRLGKQIAGLDLFHQGGGNFAVEVRFPPALVIKRVEDGEGGRSFLDGEPCDRAWFGVYQGYRRTQKIRDLLLLTRLRLKRNVEGKFGHRRPPGFNITIRHEGVVIALTTVRHNQSR
jgi:hypothetical protein